MTQANAAAEALEQTLAVPPHLTGLVLSALSLFIIFGGIRSISKITAVLVPALAGLYLAAGIVVILGNLDRLSSAICEIFRQACSFRAAAGGAAGISAMRWGIARGVFSNEAGLGSSAIAAAAAETDDPVQQGYVSMTGPFFDTIVLCTVTGLVICCSGILEKNTTSGMLLDGAALTVAAFETVLGSAGGVFVALAIVLFAFSTILGWEYLGEKAFEYLSGGRALFAYRVLFCMAALVGAISSLHAVFLLSDICNALMCMPNLICLLLLSVEFRQDLLRFERIKIRKKL
jgi:AGCS family alanine or glycine:cation symporter